jgi:hypothetical protein
MESPTDRAIYIIQYCLDKLLKEVTYQYGYSLEQESYSRWAAKELLNRLRENPTIPPLLIIEEFRDQMDEYSNINPDTNLVFNSGRDLAEWIINLLIA